ncbi:MAG: antibiotic ABC transporter ATP-binding protein, partial [Odoribacter sp.]|nr:antibiotic ABC transporter ATP-binding protein [Odoribacter sp.]
ALIGYVPQEPILFNDSVYNNICLGIEEKVDISKVIEAAKTANAHDFISALEHGYDTETGDRGCKLSGGQKQRICIARALLKKPSVFVFDEATSAQDSESEVLIQQAMQAVMKDRTVIVIAHKLATVQHADEIIVIDKGEIVETGKHEDLIARMGIYKHLYELQTFV